MRTCIVIAVAMSLTTGHRVSAQTRLALDWPAVAEKIVERMSLEAGERILLVACSRS